MSVALLDMLGPSTFTAVANGRDPDHTAAITPDAPLMEVGLQMDAIFLVAIWLFTPQPPSFLMQNPRPGMGVRGTRLQKAV
jgi:hypothetical protein